MKELQFDLWELISTLEQKMPLSVENTEIILDRKLHEEKKTDHYVLLSCEKAPLKDGVFVLPRLMLAPDRQFDLTSALAIELDGGCISRAEIEKHFGELSLTQVPRGRSLEETAVWTTKRPWGFLSFAFKERSPDCLFSVSFRRK